MLEHHTKYRFANWFLPSSSMKLLIVGGCVMVSAVKLLCYSYARVVFRQGIHRSHARIGDSPYVLFKMFFFFCAMGISALVIIFCGKNREMRVMHVLWNSWNWDLWMRIKSRSIWRRRFSNETEKLSVDNKMLTHIAKVFDGNAWGIWFGSIKLRF